MICQVCKGLSSPQRFDQATHLRAPLDSTAIDPITRSPHKHETGKIENLSRSYLCLEHSTWARWRRSWLTQDGTPFLIVLPSTCSAWWRLASCSPYTIMGETSSPIHHYGRDPFRQIFIWPQSPNGWQASSKGFFRDAYLELPLLKLDDEHHLTSSTMGYMKSFFWCMPMERYLNTNRNATHTHIMG